MWKTRFDATAVLAIVSVLLYAGLTLQIWFTIPRPLPDELNQFITGPIDGSYNGWQTGWFWAGLPLLLGLSLVALVLIRRVQPRRLPESLPPATPLLLGSGAAVVIVLKVLIGVEPWIPTVPGVDPSDYVAVDRSASLFMALLATAGLVLAGARESGDLRAAALADGPRQGWWQASDGNWYPPDQYPGPSPPLV